MLATSIILKTTFSQKSMRVTEVFKAPPYAAMVIGFKKQRFTFGDWEMVNGESILTKDKFSDGWFFIEYYPI